MGILISNKNELAVRALDTGCGCRCWVLSAGCACGWLPLVVLGAVPSCARGGNRVRVGAGAVCWWVLGAGAGCCQLAVRALDTGCRRWLCAFEGLWLVGELDRPRSINHKDISYPVCPIPARTYVCRIPGAARPAWFQVRSGLLCIFREAISFCW